jgi:general secretion pathway protein D
MFAEAGTSASLRRSATGLSQYSMDTSGTSSSGSTTSAQSTSSQTSYTPWWSGAGARQTVNTEMPISNVIGRIRFVPDSRTKSILVLSPPEYVPEIQRLIASLDIPGKQVMIKAIIVEVDHKNLSSLGVQLASNPAAFGTLDENSITALSALTDLERHGTITLGAGGSITGRGITNTLTADVSVLIDFLAKKVNAKVLNQQTLWTEDNEEASFFKGNKVAFFTSATSSATAGNVQNFEFQRVGMTLAVRPSITPNNDVDMIINIIISQLTAEEENTQPVRTEMETKTNMIIEDGQTLMLGGILFQQDSVTNRKVPLLGDIPLLGMLFSHNETIAANNEMLVFITPYVIDEPDKTGAATKEEIQRSKERLDSLREELNTTMEGLTK